MCILYIYALLWSCSTAIIWNFDMSNQGSGSIGWTVVLQLFHAISIYDIEHWCLHEFRPPSHKHQTKIVFHRFLWFTSLSILGSVVGAHIFKDASMLANSIAVTCCNCTLCFLSGVKIYSTNIFPQTGSVIKHLCRMFGTHALANKRWNKNTGDSKMSKQRLDTLGTAALY